ncbi:hypothetical protein HK097_011486 [Rhizophlyctis rosea]|uniref:DUF899 domain-containing protein n=1 Tax=Rhizophlyctis rosea TaxID=64517 RepID=A0AAD5WZV8_9FUNG|nr:hypothetical protein HK097_011486 [Rhizophlyctis rosea]
MPYVVTSEEWTKARIALLTKEKELQRLRDELAAERRALPWERIPPSKLETYTFTTDAANKTATLSDLFGNASQLIIVHHMWSPTDETNCPSCSFFADQYNGVDVHLKHRDTSFVVVSRAPIEKLEAMKKRMGWTFKWVSQNPTSTFNQDLGVSVDPGVTPTVPYNYTGPIPDGSTIKFAAEMPGVSVFSKDPVNKDSNEIYHTYSTFARGVDPLNVAYQLLDLTPIGRDEDRLPWTMEWVRRKDEYED